MNGARVHGRAVDVLADDAVGLLVGIGQVATRVVLQDAVGQERERGDGAVALLGLHLVKVDGGGLHARRRARLEAPQRDIQRPQGPGEVGGGEEPLGTALPVAFADDDAAVHVYAGADDHGLAGDLRAGGGAQAADSLPVRQDGAAFPLANLQIRFGKQRAQHPLLIGALVGLRAQRVHGRPLARVEHPGLNERVVDRAAHLAAEGIDLAHQVALARAADGGIAGHQGDGVQVEGEQQRAKPHARAGERGFAAGVPRADDGDIKAIHVFLRSVVSVSME